MITKHKQGTVSELVAASHFVQNGYRVSIPVESFGEYAEQLHSLAGR